MSEVAALLKQRNDAEAHVARRNMAMKLSENPEFKKLVLEEFCVQECARYAQASGDPALTPVQQQDALALAQSAGHLRRWFSVIVRMGDQAEHNIPGIDDAINEARAEPAGGEQHE